LTYFDIKGVAEKVRLAFVLAGVPFDDQRISFSDWAELKATTRYGQLPCLRAGGDELYQSGAMLKYVALAEEERLYPIADLAKCVHIEEVLGVLDDLARAWRPCVAVVSRPQDYGHPADLDAAAKDALAKTLRENFLANELPKYMAFLSAHIDATGYFLCGEAPTIADCAALPQLQYFSAGIADHVPSDCLYPYGTITSYVDRMLAIDAVKHYYEKCKAKKAYRDSKA
jgi:glutathione S-transferase|tara:strand:- start:121 stop:804 length:684 start_codon:yes stop_codon:yes gene_type:complete